LEKIAVIEVKTTSVKLQLVDIISNKYFETNKVIEMPINLTKDFYGDMFIKPTVIKEINDILKVYKQIIETNECIETICIASDIFTEAKNQNGVLNELSVVNGFKFEVLSDDERSNSVYTAVINSFNRPKGIIINVGEHNTDLVAYNRRNIVSKVTIPYGSVKLYDSHKEMSFEDREAMLKSEIDKIIDDSNFMAELPEEYDIIGSGEVFKDFGIVCRKAKKYPIELVHNFVASKTDFEKVYGLIKSYDLNSSTKIKGISLNNSNNSKIIID
jgi:exopolyphosphatase/guanosine-5'-triphosphate,3'-diphosphate pyrophosphatase